MLGDGSVRRMMELTEKTLTAVDALPHSASARRQRVSSESCWITNNEDFLDDPAGCKMGEILIRK